MPKSNRNLQSDEPLSRYGLDLPSMRLAIVMVVFLGFLISYLVASGVAERRRQGVIDFLNGRADFIERQIQQRLLSYEEIMFASAGLFQIREDVNSRIWAQFVESLNLGNRYGGTRGIGFSQRIPVADLAQHEADLQDQGFSDYRVFPAETTYDSYYPVVYISPLNTTNRRAIGYDMYSEPNRRNAMNESRDSGMPVMTEPLIPIPDINKPEPPLGLIIYLPTFEFRSNPDDVASRRDAHSGFSYIVVLANDLLENLLGNELEQSRYSFKLTHTGDDGPTSLYTSPNYQNQIDNSDNVSGERSINALGHIWQLSLVADPTQHGDNKSTMWLVFLSGCLISLLIGVVLHLALDNRVNRAAYAHRNAVQNTKDELLNLASHQLRTPATGVKQYLGILLQGYAGKLSGEQKELLAKAYASNERQLEIINQLLFVAKADANQIHLTPSRFDLVKLVKSSIKGLTDTAASRQINLSFRRRRPLEIKADPQLIRLIVDNLIDNGIKYSYPDSTLSIYLDKVENEAVLKVRDRGVGIDPKNLDMLFEKFTRLKNELSDEAGGIGIGLYLSSELAKVHGGELTVESPTNGPGSVFILRLPLKANKRPPKNLRSSV